MRALVRPAEGRLDNPCHRGRVGSGSRRDLSTAADVSAKKNRRIGGAFVHLTDQPVRADALGVARRGFDLLALRVRRDPESTTRRRRGRKSRISGNLALCRKPLGLPCVPRARPADRGAARRRGRRRSARRLARRSGGRPLLGRRDVHARRDPGRAGREQVDAWIVEAAGEPVGYLQSWWDDGDAATRRAGHVPHAVRAAGAGLAATGCARRRLGRGTVIRTRNGWVRR